MILVKKRGKPPKETTVSDFIFKNEFIVTFTMRELKITEKTYCIPLLVTLRSPVLTVYCISNFFLILSTL